VRHRCCCFLFNVSSGKNISPYPLHLLFFYFACLRKCYPEGCAAPGSVPCQCNTRGLLSKLEETPPQTKINVTSKFPVGDISVVTLIRTDTTLDHSQKAEKVWSVSAWEVRVKTMQNICGAFRSGKLMRLAWLRLDVLGSAFICLDHLQQTACWQNGGL